VATHDPIDDGEADAKALLVRGTGTPFEDLEQPVGGAGVEPDAVVGDVDAPGTVLAFGRHSDVGPRIVVGELDRVRDEVLENLLQRDAIPGNRRQLVDLDLGAAVLDAGVGLVHMATVEQFEVAGDRAQRPLEIVAGDVSELAQLAVRPLELVNLAVEPVDLLDQIHRAWLSGSLGKDQRPETEQTDRHDRHEPDRGQREQAPKQTRVVDPSHEESVRKHQQYDGRDREQGRPLPGALQHLLGLPKSGRAPPACIVVPHNR